MKYNSQQKREAMLVCFSVVLLALNTALFGLAWFGYYRKQMYIYTFFAKGDIAVIGLFAAIYYIFARLYGGFDVIFRPAGELMYSHVVSLVLSCGMMYIVTALLARSLPNIFPMVGLLLAAGAAVLDESVHGIPCLHVYLPGVPPAIVRQ